MWKQCLQEHTKADNLDTKALEIVKNDIKNRPELIRDAEVVGSNPIASTKKALRITFSKPFYFVFCISK